MSNDNDKARDAPGGPNQDQPKESCDPSSQKSQEQAFDLGERTSQYGENVVKFAVKIARDPITTPLISQLVRAGTSIGANYCEADEAGSRNEFKYRISLCCRESRETKYWLRMIVAAVPEIRVSARRYWKEADELNRIFAAIARSLGRK